VGQILPTGSDIHFEWVHAQIEVFLWGLKKDEAISIACAGGFTSVIAMIPRLE